ncbi:MAG: hypothetical protein JW881_05765 [Spirochaetales bacterium]|nr:hypothetical protein [Spirochaetales bacterium]
MLEEYDFTEGIKGKYAKRYAEGSNVVVLDPEISREFKDSDNVNEALKYLMFIIKRHKKAGK